ncbi:putative entry exclusion protein TrbK-alt [Acidiphilium acidophilum]|uniref:putative entry exclusion protein TrbK-alt n=1 Tax=Acidiphilium acidophilum TaxID=76588 RepID=UPI002E8E6C20|nr:putative entry exclusion protein TrbK-alt [Acidiphilium acidophilum]
MNVKSLAAIASVVVGLSGIFAPAWAKAPTIDQLVANPKMLTAELDRCERLGMAANNDARCHTAWSAENKQFFGHGDGNYSKVPVHLFGNTPKFDPEPHSQKSHPSKPSEPPNGQ